MAKAKVDEEMDILSADSVLKIDQVDLNSTLASHPALFAYWLQKQEEAEHTLRLMNAEYEAWEARTKVDIRQQPNLKLTEGYVEELLKKNAQWLVWKQNINEAVHNSLSIKAVIEGLKEKGRLLITLGTIRKAEIEQQITNS